MTGDPRLSRDPNWVLRIASQARECDSCNDRIVAGAKYWRMLTGELYCCACPPEDEMQNICEDGLQ